MKVENPVDWKKIKLNDIASRGGRTLLNRYNHSMKSMLSAVYNDVNWDDICMFLLIY